ncbi:MAG: hypothetical protein HC838_14400 [Spirulinaceae cyanobacterium RM2_2_10]|nr:hypothetical protein [Spirulinaceae cyanobacterium SM2_1_0]NJO20984.1 hypothetical protein [Spirulinaceae cyanobacterium RM2_2_10]
MPDFTDFLQQFVPKATSSLPNLLHQRLEEALQNGDKVWIETNNDSFAGIPIRIDSDFVEILTLSAASEDEEPEDPGYKRTTWLIRLACIEAVAYPTEHWSKDRLENLLGGEESLPDRDHDED